MKTLNCKSCEILARHGQTMLVHTCGLEKRPHKCHGCGKVNFDCVCTTVPEREECKFQILSPHYDNGHNGGMWCAEKYPCKRHGDWKALQSVSSVNPSEKQEAEGCIDKLKENQDCDIEKAYPEAYRLARQFHEMYEKYAPDFGYRTREETKHFDPASRNGRLMAYVCFHFISETRKEVALKTVEEILNKIKQYRCHPDEKHCTCMDALKDYIVSTLKKSLNER